MPLNQRKNLDASLLSEALDYNPLTGLFRWKERPVAHFQKRGKHFPEVRQKMWNAKYAGKPALTTQDPRGYLGGTFQQTRIWAHRAAWAIAHGANPDGEIDHINRDKSDNRLSNLRLVTHSGNSKNREKSKLNSSGVTGVSFRKSTGQWRAYIGSEGRMRELGEFRTMDEAAATRKSAEAKFGFGPNHGA